VTQFQMVTDQAEIDRLFPVGGTRGAPLDLGEYLEFLSNVPVGGAFEVMPGEHESERSLKRRLTIAGKQLGKRVQYSKRVRDDAPKGMLVGRVLEPKQTAS